MIEIIPKGHRVLVEKLENRTYGAIELPENTKEAIFTRWKVVAVGEARKMVTGTGVIDIPIPVEVGDEIMFDVRQANSCGPADMFGGRELGIINVDGIMAVMKGEPDAPRRKIERAVVVQ